MSSNGLAIRSILSEKIRRRVIERRGMCVCACEEGETRRERERDHLTQIIDPTEPLNAHAVLDSTELFF